MKAKYIGIALLVLGVVAGTVWAERQILPDIELTDQIITKVVSKVASEVKSLAESNTSYNGLLVRATNEYRDEYRAVLQDRIIVGEPHQPDVPILGQEQNVIDKIVVYFRALYAHGADVMKYRAAQEEQVDKVFGTYFDDLTERVKLDPGVGILLLLPIWQDRAAALIEAEGATEAMIPMLQKTYELLKGGPRARLLAERGRLVERDEKDDVIERFDAKHKFTYTEMKDYNWIIRQEQKLEGVGKVAIQLIAQAAGELLNRLKAIEAKKRQFQPVKPAASTPAVATTPAPAAPVPSAAAASGTPKTVKRW